MNSKKSTRALLLIFNALVIIFLISIPYWGIFSPPRPKKELNLFVWGAFLSPHTIAEFEKEYDAKVNLHFCTTNEEMLTKLRNSKKGEFDLVFGGDYAVKMLLQENALQPIDKTQLNFFHRLSPITLNHPHDPQNQYSIPYSWEVYGIAENHTLITPTKEATLDRIFQPQIPMQKVAMIPDPVEAFTTAAYYLHKKTTNLTEKQIQETIDLLRKQRTWVEAYVDYRAKYLITTENCPIGLVKSSFLVDMANDDMITYRLPKEGIFLSVEHLFIPKKAKHETTAYEFLNHIFKKQSYHETYKFCAMFPACLDAIEGSILDIEQTHQIIKEVHSRNDLVIYDYIMPPADLREAWISIKR